VEFEFPVIIEKTYPLKKKNEDSHDMFVIRFSYMGGKGFAYSRQNVTDEQLKKQEAGPANLKFKIRFSDRGTFLWTSF